jgi:hypothetical protein
MATKQITNPGQAFSLGGTYLPPVDDAMTTNTTQVINATGQILYTGDIVCLDVTGTQAVLATSAGDPRQIGTVGSNSELSHYPTAVADYPTSAQFITMTAQEGNLQPYQDFPASTLSLGFTNGSTTITSSSTATVNPLIVGAYVYTPYNATTNATPQVFQIVSLGGSTGAWTAVGAVVSGAGTTFSGTTGTFVTTQSVEPVQLGPGWQVPTGWSSTSTFQPGIVVPIVTQGFGRVNISGVTAEVASDLISVSGSGSVVGARTAAGSGTSVGSFIAVTLEAYATRDQALTNLGITGHDSVRAIIGKM